MSGIKQHKKNSVKNAQNASTSINVNDSKEKLLESYYEQEESLLSDLSGLVSEWPNEKEQHQPGPDLVRALCQLISYIGQMRSENQRLRRQIFCLNEMRKIDQIKKELLTKEERGGCSSQSGAAEAATPALVAQQQCGCRCASSGSAAAMVVQPVDDKFVGTESGTDISESLPRDSAHSSLRSDKSGSDATRNRSSIGAVRADSLETDTLSAEPPSDPVPAVVVHRASTSSQEATMDGCSSNSSSFSFRRDKVRRQGWMMTESASSEVSISNHELPLSGKSVGRMLQSDSYSSDDQQPVFAEVSLPNGLPSHHSNATAQQSSAEEKLSDANLSREKRMQEEEQVAFTTPSRFWQRFNLYKRSSSTPDDLKESNCQAESKECRPVVAVIKKRKRKISSEESEDDGADDDVQHHTNTDLKSPICKKLISLDSEEKKYMSSCQYQPSSRCEQSIAPAPPANECLPKSHSVSVTNIVTNGDFGAAQSGMSLSSCGGSCAPKCRNSIAEIKCVMPTIWKADARKDSVSSHKSRSVTFLETPVYENVDALRQQKSDSQMTISNDSVFSVTSSTLDPADVGQYSRNLLKHVLVLQDKNSILIGQLKEKSREYERITEQLFSLEKQVQVLKERYRTDELDAFYFSFFQPNFVPIAFLKDAELQCRNLDKMVQQTKNDMYNQQQATHDSIAKQQLATRQCLDDIEKMHKQFMHACLPKHSQLLPSFESLYSFTLSLVRLVKHLRQTLQDKQASANSREIELAHCQSQLLLAHVQIERQKLELRLAGLAKGRKGHHTAVYSEEYPEAIGLWRSQSYHGQDFLSKIVFDEMSFYLPFSLRRHASRAALEGAAVHAKPSSCADRCSNEFALPEVDLLRLFAIRAPASTVPGGQSTAVSQRSSSNNYEEIELPSQHCSRPGTPVAKPGQLRFSKHQHLDGPSSYASKRAQLQPRNAAAACGDSARLSKSYYGFQRRALQRNKDPPRPQSYHMAQAAPQQHTPTAIRRFVEQIGRERTAESSTRGAEVAQQLQPPPTSGIPPPLKLGNKGQVRAIAAVFDPNKGGVGQQQQICSAPNSPLAHKYRVRISPQPPAYTPNAYYQRQSPLAELQPAVRPQVFAAAVPAATRTALQQQQPGGTKAAKAEGRTVVHRPAAAAVQQVEDSCRLRRHKTSWSMGKQPSLDSPVAAEQVHEDVKRTKSFDAAASISPEGDNLRRMFIGRLPRLKLRGSKGKVRESSCPAISSAEEGCKQQQSSWIQKLRRR